MTALAHVFGTEPPGTATLLVSSALPGSGTGLLRSLETTAGTRLDRGALRFAEGALLPGRFHVGSRPRLNDRRLRALDP